MTGLGALAMLAGFIILGEAAGTYRLSAILADPPGGTTVTVALLLILARRLHEVGPVPVPQLAARRRWWRPTPVSAYLHSATMVKAGVYLVARLAPAFAVVGVWRPLVVVVGLVTMIGGGLRALRQTDLKLLLAMGTISQLGFMMIVLGWGDAETATAGAVVLLGHGAFKAAAFMVVGILDHQHGTRDVRELPRPAPGWAPVTVVAVIAAGSMAGLPLLFGFIGKEADFEALYDAGSSGRLTLAFVVVGSVLTAAYSLRFVRGVTGRLAPTPAGRVRARRRGAAGVVRGAGGGAGRRHGAARGCGRRWPTGSSTAAATALVGPIAPVHLAIWHGLTVPLELSALALAARRRGRPLRPARPARPRARGRPPHRRRRVPGHAPGRQPGRQPRHPHRPARVAADLPRRHPRHRRGRARRGAADRHLVAGLARPRQHAGPGRRRSRSSSASASPPPPSTAASPPRCSSAWPATRWPASSSSRARPTSPSPRSPSRR